MKQIKIPNYSKEEEVINSVTHAVGSVAALIGLIMLVKRSLLQNSSITLISSIIFGLALFILYLSSSLYHGIPKQYKLKKAFRVIDHCNVFILEAGTFTPVCLLLLKGFLGLTYFIIIWILALIGIILNIINVDKYENISLFFHLFIGWSILLVFNRLISSLTIEGLRYIFGGGLIYTVGAFLYYIGAKKKYMHSVFHFFCLAGSFFHFLLVYLFLL